MKIIIETIPQKNQRYLTVGDYWDETDGTKRIAISEMGDWRYAVLVAVHELIESAICETRGISEPDIAAFDVEHPELGDPGRDERAPYHREHMFADCVERLLARELGVNWEQYDAMCDAVWDSDPRAK